MDVEVGVDASEECADEAPVASGKGGNDAEDEDAEVEQVGLAAAVAGIDEAERVLRGGGPAVAKQHPAEVLCVEEDPRLPLQAAVDWQIVSANAIEIGRDN